MIGAPCAQIRWQALRLMAKFGFDLRFAFTVHFHFAGSGAAPHADILDCATKSGQLMALEVRQCQNDVSNYQRLPDFCFIYSPFGTGT